MQARASTTNTSERDLELLCAIAPGQAELGDKLLAAVSYG